MKALTLWQPWAYAVAHLGKDVENRQWKPWAGIIGQRIAIHASKRWVKRDMEAWCASLVIHGLAEELPLAALAEQCGKVVATARVTEIVEASDSVWFTGPYGWVLADVAVLKTPIACRGAQGMWDLPPDVFAMVEAQHG